MDSDRLQIKTNTVHGLDYASRCRLTVTHKSCISIAVMTTCHRTDAESYRCRVVGSRVAKATSGRFRMIRLHLYMLSRLPSHNEQQALLADSKSLGLGLVKRSYRPAISSTRCAWFHWSDLTAATSSIQKDAPIVVRGLSFRANNHGFGVPRPQHRVSNPITSASMQLSYLFPL